MSAMPPVSRSSRLVALAAIAWIVALLAASPGAADQARPAGPPANPHRDLSLFTHSDNCIACHNNLAAASGEDVSIGTAWRATMMAHSSRDPYWQASVRREANRPSVAGVRHRGRMCRVHNADGAAHRA
jgi:mono/diheme cytochrome c family protein